MAHHKSKEKSDRTDARKRLKNRSVKSRCRTLEKKFRTAAASGERLGLEEMYQDIQKVLDQAAGHGVLRRETVSRKKSRLMKVLSQATKQPAA